MRYAPLLAAALLAGCTVGPNYAGPPTVDAARFVRAQDAALTPAPTLARWWESLADPTLTTLVDDALAHSPSIDEATARIRAARAQLTQQRAAQRPSVSANATYLRAQLPGVGLGQTDGEARGSSGVDFYNLGLNASWELDLFGGGRRTVEQQRATIDARVADLADAQVSLSAEVASAYVSLRDVQARLRLNTASAALQERQVAIARQRYAGGTVSLLDVERLRGLLENTQADASPLATQRDEYLNQLAVLTGRTPGALDTSLSTARSVPLPPRQVPIAGPAALIASRPDVRAAERQLAASSAAIGVAKAKELPGIRFLGLLGLGGTGPGAVLDPDNLTTLIAPSLNWSFLDFGRNRAATRQSEAQRDLADATYRHTVLAALQDAENALSRFGNTRAQLAQLTRAEATARRSEQLNAQRVAAGTSALGDQLDIERQRVAATIAVEQASAQLTLGYIAVNKALGLGWTPVAEESR